MEKKLEKNLEKTYDPQDIEKRLYEKWLNKKYFHAKVDKKKKPFTIVMPPPNITGKLHMGHALDNTMQDILIRAKRMQGYEALWLPGTDHASIATEAKIVEAMRSEGLTKADLGREKFLERAWDWKANYGGRIVSQLKKIGSSCDWDRERFTMDEGCNKAVNEVFVNLYNNGLIYRGERIINWCPHCLTSISDAEVEYEEKEGHFWHLRYQLSDGSGEVKLATTRPETLLGDTAIAVNPNDDRYKNIIGKSVILPLVKREIPVVADDYVEMDFGTGVVKITPAHDPNDFEVGVRHNLPIINVMTDDAKIINDYPKYAGMDRYEARKAIVADLEAEGALVKVEDHNHNVGTCYRCGTVVEPRVSKQWFVKMKPLAEPAIKAVREGETKFVPEHFNKTYFHWLENIRDWCISRQLWWGHQIPAYYCDDCGEMVVTKDSHATCPKCNKDMRRDPDTLDTWFSSALWPFSTLGWPDNTEEMNYFYPTNVLVTGYDIIPFWVMRMMFSGLEHTKEVPFSTVLIHGLVRDSQGRKMSKSLGNGIDPLEIIDQYGADALRLTLITGNAPGNDMRFYMERVEASRNFANKVWNASRFIMMNFEKAEISDTIDLSTLTQADKWILSKVNTLTKDVTENLEKFELGIAVQKIYDFIWEEFCDWYIEMVKPRLYNDEDETKAAALWTLKTVLIDSLKLLHPYMPFITEEIFCTLQEKEESIMISEWPVYKEELNFATDEEAVEVIKAAVKGIRNVRSEMNVPPSKKATVIVVSENEKVRTIFETSRVFFATLGYASEIIVQNDKTNVPEDAVSTVIPDAAIYMPFAELVDIEKEIERLEKEKARLEGELKRVNGMLNNEKFVSKAPEAKINEEKAKLDNYTNMMNQVTERLSHLKK
ncbi:valine--tRNA ligase [Anaeromicropila herbilytica]|uniref:Valine--tRNA ligase n=1 Tax=Anaeromicropila herbilytica TaxID=2785025 RepID=A0A7R7IDH7_9FIRM|nr:valine--tRNA ligase [Anaeromicropila herbilytica]BCN30023.1 valine--tRNA ligase [Anaeromicropila herbilytica]